MQAAGKKLGDGKRDMEGVLDSIKSAKGNLESSLENAREVICFNVSCITRVHQRLVTSPYIILYW